MRLADVAVAEYGRTVSSVPFGSEWEITLTGEERWWSDQTNAFYDDRIVASAKATLQIPSVEPSVCEIIEDIELMLGLYPNRDFNALDPMEQEGFRLWVQSSMLPPIQEIRFNGSAEWTTESSFWRTSDGEVRGECPACPRIDKRIGFTEYVVIDVNGFSIPSMGTFTPGDEVVGADPPPRTCVRTWRDGSDTSVAACPGTGLQTVPVLGGYWDLQVFQFIADTVRVNDYQSQGPSFYSYQTDMTLRLIRPHDPITEISYANCKDCNDSNLCTRDTYVPGVGCKHEALNGVFDFHPHDCYKNECQNGYRMDTSDDSDTPPQASPNDCEKQICRAGSQQTVADVTENPPLETGNCRREVCGPFGVQYQEDNTDEPIQDSPYDCLREVCQMGEPISVPDDSETPLPDADGTPRVCRNGEAVPAR